MSEKVVALCSATGQSATSVHFSDNQKIPYSMVKEICDLSWNNSYMFPWKQNDLLVVDNIAIAHGRMNVVGPRKITVSLGNMYHIYPSSWRVYAEGFPGFIWGSMGDVDLMLLTFSTSGRGDYTVSSEIN